MVDVVRTVAVLLSITMGAVVAVAVVAVVAVVVVVVVVIVIVVLVASSVVLVGRRYQPYLY